MNLYECELLKQLQDLFKELKLLKNIKKYFWYKMAYKRVDMMFDNDIYSDAELLCIIDRCNHIISLREIEHKIIEIKKELKIALEV
jgi:hypothetical protein